MASGLSLLLIPATLSLLLIRPAWNRLDFVLPTALGSSGAWAAASSLDSGWPFH
jgi:hypothetical protein